VRFKVPPGKRVTRVELPLAGADVPFRVSGGKEFAIPKAVDREGAALYPVGCRQFAVGVLSA
jgi:hypothetical protein